MSVKEAADHLLEVSGLMDVLSKYGKPVPVGSYRMDLMAWQNLDISMAGPVPDAEQYRRITQEVEAALRPCFNEAEWLPGNNRCSLGIETFRTGRRWGVDICWRSEADIAETLRQYYDTLTDYDRAKQFIMLSFGTVNTSDAAFKDRVYNSLLQDSGAQLLLYINGMWQLDGWQLDPAWAPAMRGATDLLAEYLTAAVNGEKVVSDNSQSLVAMGGQALAEALNVLGESDAAEAVLAAEGDAASAAPAPDSDTASAVIDGATDALRAHFNVKVFQVILLILGAVAVFVLIFSVVLLVNHNKPNRRRRK